MKEGGPGANLGSVRTKTVSGGQGEHGREDSGPTRRPLAWRRHATGTARCRSDETRDPAAIEHRSADHRSSRCFPGRPHGPKPGSPLLRGRAKPAGPARCLAGRAAAHLLHLLKRRPSLPEVLTACRRRPSAVVVRRCRRIDPNDRTSWRGVPVTNVPRTIVDLAAVLDPPTSLVPFTKRSSSIAPSPTPSTVFLLAVTTGPAPVTCAESSGVTSPSASASSSPPSSPVPPGRPAPAR